MAVLKRHCPAKMLKLMKAFVVNGSKSLSFVESLSRFFNRRLG